MHAMKFDPKHLAVEATMSVRRKGTRPRGGGMNAEVTVLSTAAVKVAFDASFRIDMLVDMLLKQDELETDLPDILANELAGRTKQLNSVVMRVVMRGDAPQDVGALYKSVHREPMPAEQEATAVSAVPLPARKPVRKAKAPVLTLVPSIRSEDTIGWLQQLLAEALRGELVGLAFAAQYRGRKYAVEATGEALHNPTFAAGMVSNLKYLLGRRARGEAD